MPESTEKVTVALKRTYGYQGTYYGPGEAVEVPQPLADSLGLKPASASEKKAAKAAAPTGASADTLTIENGTDKTGEVSLAEVSSSTVTTAARKKSAAKRPTGAKKKK